MFLHDMKKRAIAWERKQSRWKQTVIVSAIFVLAVLASVAWNLLQGNQIRWVIIAVLAAAGIVSFLFSLSAYTNTTLVAMYYMACYRFLEAPEDLELVTGTIEEVARVNMPYIGMLYQVTLRVAGERVRYYFPGKLLRGLNPQDRIRVLTHDLFAIRVEPTHHVEAAPESTKLA